MSHGGSRFFREAVWILPESIHLLKKWQRIALSEGSDYVSACASLEVVDLSGAFHEPVMPPFGGVLSGEISAVVIY